MHSWKFTDEEGNLCRASYSEKSDKFLISFITTDGKWGLSLFTYYADEVEDYLNRGIWRRLS